jgi:aryl-alcohol dehydrogenase-like predicted oxidoreductase
MKQRPLGTTGLVVGAIGFGGVPLSCVRKRPSEGDAIAVIHHAIDCGITLIDTADSYCLDDTEYGHNERLIAKALGELPSETRERIVVATKGGWIRPGGSWIPCGTPEHLRRQCEQSLRSLGTDCIDLYQHHTPDSNVPVGESVGEIARLREEGKIRFIGVSNYSVAQLAEAQAVTEISSLQNQYSPNHREPENDGTLEETRQQQMAFLPWSPLGGLGGARTLAQDNPGLVAIAERLGVSPYRVALAWLLAKGDHVLPIPGASRPETIEDSSRAAALDLTEEEVQRLDASLR